MSDTWDQRLLKRSSFDEILDRLERRGQDRRDLLSTAPVTPELDLRWILYHRDKVVGEIISCLKSGELEFGLHQVAQVMAGKLRTFYVASWADRILLMAMAAILAKELDPLIGPRVFSFRTGRGARDAHKDLARYLKRCPSRTCFILKRDITQYGDSIPQDLLFARLSAETLIDANPLFLKLLKQAIRVSFAQKKSMDAVAVLIQGIPSGSPLVPTLENYYLTPLDARLSAFPGSFYARYGDDFVFATPDLATAREAVSACDASVAELGLSMKEEKMQNLQLLLTGSPHAAVEAPDFKVAAGFDWLGKRIVAKGRLGAKRDHYKRALQHLKSEITRLVQRHSELKYEDPFKIQLLSAALRELLDTRSQSVIQSYLYSQENDRILEETDRYLAQQIVVALHSKLSIGKKRAWKLYRDLRVPSLKYLRHHPRAKI